MYTFVSEVIILLASVVQSQAEASRPRQIEVARDVKRLLVELAAVTHTPNVGNKLDERRLKEWRPHLDHSAGLDKTTAGKGHRMSDRVYIPECGSSVSCGGEGDSHRMNMADFEFVNETTRKTLENVDEELRNFEAYVLGPEGLSEQLLERLGEEKERLVMIRGRLLPRRDVLDQNLKQIKAYSQKAMGQLAINDSSANNEVVVPMDRLQRLERVERLLEKALEPLDSHSHQQQQRALRNLARSSMSVASYLEKVPRYTTSILSVALLGLFAAVTGAGFALLHFRSPAARARAAAEEPLLM